VVPPQVQVGSLGAVESSVPEVGQTGLHAAGNAFSAFEWSELESTNYLVYIANLRRLKCPEQTIHDLVSAEIAAVYSERRALIEQELKAALSAGLLPACRGAEKKLQTLQNERDRLVESLMHPEPSAGVAAESGAVATSDEVGTNQTMRAVMPLFLKTPKQDLHLDVEQLEAMNEVREPGSLRSRLF
jgi:hypothetical protein